MRTKSAFVLASLSVLALVGVADAGVIFNFSGSGSSAGTPVSATASFDVSAGGLSLVLTNTTPHTADAGQLLTGIRFSLKNGVTDVSDGSGFTATGVERTVAGDGSYTNGGAPTALSWESGFGGGLYQFDFNPDAKDALLGPADGETGVPLSGVYTANGSINGNPGHTPYAGKTATFTLSSANINLGTVVGDVTFIYNTALSQDIPSGPPGGGVPEPASLGMLGAGAIGLLLRRRR